MLFLPSIGMREFQNGPLSILMSAFPHSPSQCMKHPCRKIYLVTSELLIDNELGLKPNCGRVVQLSWLTHSTLLATSHEGIQTWQCHGDNSRPCLLLGMSIGLVSADASPDQSTLAAGSRDGVVGLKSLYIGPVHCWPMRVLFVYI